MEACTDKSRNDNLVSFYRWALEDAVREVTEKYPFISKIRSSKALAFVDLLQNLPQSSQLEALNILVRAAHQQACELCGEVITVEESRYRKYLFDKVWEIQNKYIDDHQLDKYLSGKDREKRIAALQRIYRKYVLNNEQDEQTPIFDYESFGRKSADKRRLARLIKKKLATVCGAVAEEDSPQIWYHVIRFENYAVWTDIDTGGNYQIRYSQKITPPNSISSFSGEFDLGTSIMKWMGLLETAWDVLYEGEEEQAADVLAAITKHFIVSVPKFFQE